MAVITHAPVVWAGEKTDLGFVISTAKIVTVTTETPSI
jgi:hypothetical protein